MPCLVVSWSVLLFCDLSSGFLTPAEAGLAALPEMACRLRIVGAQIKNKVRIASVKVRDRLGR